jgi:hypothetical protein
MAPYQSFSNWLGQAKIEGIDPDGAFETPGGDRRKPLEFIPQT